MSENIRINQVDGADVVQYIPSGVCSKLLQFRIKDDIIQDFEAVGGCSGNLKGIGMLIKGMSVSDASSKLQGLPCGNRPTSCPDQISLALKAYAEEKVHANV